jgi:predicted Zn-dependent protease
MEASYGGLLGCDENRYRTVSSRVRIGSYQLDNTNFLRSYGGRARFAIDDDYVALRHAIWLLTDGDYKRAVEALARKEAFLKEKTVVDRPDDFSPAELAVAVEPSPELVFDRMEWEENLKRLSARFGQHPEIQDSGVSLYAGAVNEWVVNSEEARVRTGDTGIYVEVDAEIQAPDGMRLTDHRTYIGEQFDQLPPIEKMLADVDEMCRGLVLLSNASVLEHYDGPVLFEPLAAGKMFHALLADGLCARPIPLGAGGWGDESLEKKIGRRVLPRSFQVVDDPGPEWFEGTILAGAYTYDDEGVRATRVSLVENGILKTLLASRAPTRKIKHTTGHAMNSGYGDAQAHIGCLYVSDDKAVTSDELTEALIQAARDEGLDFGLRVVSIEEGGHGALGDPIYAYKVYVEDGREELVRGMEFLTVERRALKHILAAGEDRKVYNSTSGVTSSVISPAVLFEELELTKIEEELDKLPILKSPATRGAVD